MRGWRKELESFVDCEGYESDWGDREYSASESESDTDSASDLDKNTNNTSDCEASTAETNSSSSSDATEQELEEIQAELAELQVPPQNESVSPNSRARRLRERKLHRNRNHRQQTVLDLRSQSPSSDSEESISSQHATNFRPRHIPSSRKQYLRRRSNVIESDADDDSESSTEASPAGDQNVFQFEAGIDFENLAEDSMDSKNCNRLITPPRLLYTHSQSTTARAKILTDNEPIRTIAASPGSQNRVSNSPAEIVGISSDEEPDSSSEDGHSSEDEHSSPSRSASPLQFDLFSRKFDSTKYESTKSCFFNDEELTMGKTVGLKKTAAGRDGCFLRIFNIIKEKKTSKIFLLGRIFVSTSELHQPLGSEIVSPKEVTAILAHCLSNKSSIDTLDKYSLQDVECVRELEVIHDGQIASENHNILTCQTILKLQFRTQQDQEGRKTELQGYLGPVKPANADNPGTVRYRPRKSHKLHKSNGKFTFVDICCSLGGATEGATLAGFEVTHGVERDKQRVEVYKRNNPRAKIHQEDLHDLSSGFTLCDIVAAMTHFSPSCKPFSQQHTVNGKDDELNKQLTRNIPDYIEQIEPPHFTIEQVPGLIVRHRREFQNLIFGIRGKGYTVAWKVIDFKTLESPCERERLILIGAAPGEALPPFPEDINGLGRKPFITARQALADMRFDQSSEAEKRRPSGPFHVVDPDKPFPVTLVCKGEPTIKKKGVEHVLVHWDTKMTFTTAQKARLATFSDYRIWLGGPSQRSNMIGDAVPPKPMSHIYAEIRKTKEDTERGDRSVSCSLYDIPTILNPAALTRLLCERVEDSELPNLAELMARNVAARSNVPRKRLAPPQARDVLQKKQKTHR